MKPTAPFRNAFNVLATTPCRGQRVEVLEQGLADLRTLANEYEYLRVLEALSERVSILRVIVPDRYFVSVQLAEARESSKRVEIVVENRNLHNSLWRSNATGS